MTRLSCLYYYSFSFSNISASVLVEPCTTFVEYTSLLMKFLFSVIESSIDLFDVYSDIFLLRSYDRNVANLYRFLDLLESSQTLVDELRITRVSIFGFRIFYFPIVPRPLCLRDMSPSEFSSNESNLTSVPSSIGPNYVSEAWSMQRRILDNGIERLGKLDRESHCSIGQRKYSISSIITVSTWRRLEAHVVTRFFFFLPFLDVPLPFLSLYHRTAYLHSSSISFRPATIHHHGRVSN